MRCGTVFNDDPDEDQDNESVFADVERIATQLEWRAKQIRNAITHCRAKRSTQGLTEMVAYSFNAQQHTPQYGGGGANLPPGDYTGVIVNSTQDNTAAGTGGFMAFHLTPIEGNLKGQVHIDRLNLHNTNAKTVEIANKQLSAYCHVLGKFQFNDTSELHNIPFKFKIGWQKGQEPSEANPNGGYTEVKAIYDMQGNEPGKQGQPPAGGFQQQPQIPNQPAGNVQPMNNGAGAWGGAPQGQQPQQQQQPQQGFQQQPQQGVDNNVAPPGGFVQQPQQQPAGNGWGGAPQGQQPQQQPQQQQPQQGQAPGGWNQQPQGQGGGAPQGWGQS